MFQFFELCYFKICRWFLLSTDEGKGENGEVNSTFEGGKSCAVFQFFSCLFISSCDMFSSLTGKGGE